MEEIKERDILLNDTEKIDTQIVDIEKADIHEDVNIQENIDIESTEELSEHSQEDDLKKYSKENFPQKPIMYQLEKTDAKSEDDKNLEVIHVNKREDQKKILEKEEPMENSWKVFLFGLLGFFVPIAGLVIYLSMKESHPKSSVAAGIGALCSAVGCILICFTFAFLFLVGIGAIFF